MIAGASLVAAWLATPFLALAALCAILALWARPLFVTAMGLLAAGAAASAFLALTGRGEAALALVLLTAAWTPLFFLGSILLSKRAVRPLRWLAWASFAAGLALVSALVWVGVAEPLAPVIAADARATNHLALWLAPVAMAGIYGCVALLGFGERGGLGAPGDAP
jgi:hypothetical protein